MKKIGIATQYTNSCNYGGVLQAYALCLLLNKNGFDAVQINYISKGRSVNDKFKNKIKNGQFINALKNLFKSFYFRIAGYFNNSSKEVLQRNQAFDSFRNNIPHTEIIYNDDTISFCTEFDVYITGSDQVWNIGPANIFSDFYWLNFISESKKKISYAASISKKDFPQELYPKVEKLLSDYTAISVREKQDKELLDLIIGKDKAKWVLDPTLLLSRYEWEKLCEDNEFIDKPYVFVYLLGDNKTQRKFVIEWAKKNNKIVINIPYLLGKYRSCDRKFGDIRKSDVTPNLWLSLIRDADYVFTNFFYGMVFFTIFHTPFICFKRSSDKSQTSMNYRIYSLLEMFGYENCLVTKFEDIEKLNTIDFEIIDSSIYAIKQSSFDFLRESIERVSK